MAKQTLGKQLSNVVSRLQEERQAHLDAIAELDALFSEYGITPPQAGRRRKVKKKAAKRKKKRTAKRATKKAGRKKKPAGRGKKRTKRAQAGRKKKKTTTKKRGKKAAKARGRKRTGPTAGDIVLAFVGRSKKGVRGADIIEHLTSKGRGGKGAYVLISKMVKDKKLKKKPLKGERGSLYAAA